MVGVVVQVNPMSGLPVQVSTDSGATTAVTVQLPALHVLSLAQTPRSTGEPADAPGSVAIRPAELRPVVGVRSQWEPTKRCEQEQMGRGNFRGLRFPGG